MPRRQFRELADVLLFEILPEPHAKHFVELTRCQQADGSYSVKPSGAQQCGIASCDVVGGSDDEDAFPSVNAVEVAPAVRSPP